MKIAISADGSIGEGRFSICVEHTQAEQIEVGTTIHGPLNQFETVDLAFRLPIAVWQGESGGDSRLISFETRGKYL